MVLEEKIKEKFDSLIGITTDFTSSEIFPIKKDIDRIRKVERLYIEK